MTYPELVEIYFGARDQHRDECLFWRMNREKYEEVRDMKDFAGNRIFDMPPWEETKFDKAVQCSTYVVKEEGLRKGITQEVMCLGHPVACVPDADGISLYPVD